MDVFDTDEAKRHHDNLLEILEKVNFIDDKNSAVALFTEGINRLSKHHGINGMSTFAAMFVDAWQMFAMNHFVGSIANNAVNSTVKDMFKKAGLDGGKS